MAPQLLHVLFEHAAGYALFRVKEFEEIAMFQPTAEKSVIDISRFNSAVKLVAFMPFRSGVNALDNMNSITEGILHDDLKLFLETNLPKTTKKEKSVLGVADSKLAAVVSEELGVSCLHTDAVPEILRGIRVHFHKLIKGLTDVTAAKAQLGLGHSYSRAKVKFNVNRVDNMIIQSISLLDQLDKDINTFSMRIREWYSYHFPELVKIINDNQLYARVAQYIGNHKELTDDKLEGLEEIVMDSAKVKAIQDASRSSMGMDISAIDLINIEKFAERVIALTEYRKSLHDYLQNKMTSVAPNLSTLIGDQVGARLISHAGSLTNLAKYPASTVQILGAEKALFRALKTRGNTPKYGLIFHSTFIGRADSKNKGRISRYLANKCSIASRIDCFMDYPTTIFGEHLKDQVESRLRFYETGDVPPKNIDVMKEAMEEAAVVRAKFAKKERKRLKKEKKLNALRMSTELNSTVDDSVVMDTSVTNESGKKKKKHKRKQSDDVDNCLVDEEEKVDETAAECVSGKKKKHKRKKTVEDSMEVEAANISVLVAEDDNEVIAKKKHKRKKTVEDSTEVEAANTSVLVAEDDNEVMPKKKHKRKKTAEDSMEVEAANTSVLVAEDDNDEVIAKKKKKKRKSKGLDA